MKTFLPVPVALHPSRGIRQSRAVEYRLAAKRSRLRRFQRFIETTDWEDRYLCNKGIDKICLGGLIACLVYFPPLLISILSAM